MSSVLKFVDQLVKETSPADDVPRLEMQEGGRARLPVTAKQQELAQSLYGKDFKDFHPRILSFYYKGVSLLHHLLSHVYALDRTSYQTVYLLQPVHQ